MASTHLTNKLLPKLLNRPKKSGIINISSTFIYIPMYSMALYCASKAYNDVFSRSLSTNHKDKLDIVSIRPAIVTTAASGFFKDFSSVSPELCARGSLKALGVTNVSNGHWYQVMQGWVFPIIG
jgi:short-subunit dehydrogenase